MKLYLVRHGEAAAAQENPKRPLNQQGRDEVTRAAQFLRRAGIQVNEIFHSDKKRAQETAQIIKNFITPTAKLIQHDSLGPGDSIEPILNELNKRQEDLMLVGHLPFLPRLISQLILGEEDKPVIGLKTSAVAAMCRDAHQQWQIVWVVSPVLLLNYE